MPRLEEEVIEKLETDLGDCKLRNSERVLDFLKFWGIWLEFSSSCKSGLVSVVLDRLELIDFLTFFFLVL